MRWANSIPATVIAAFAKDLNPAMDFPTSMWTSNLTGSRHLNEIFFDTL